MTPPARPERERIGRERKEETTVGSGSGPHDHGPIGRCWRRARTGRPAVPADRPVQRDWLLRVVLDWFAGTRGTRGYRWSPANGATWFSGGLAPVGVPAEVSGGPAGGVADARRRRGGPPEIGDPGATDLALGPRDQLAVVEAKIYGKLSSGVRTPRSSIRPRGASPDGRGTPEGRSSSLGRWTPGFFLSSPRRPGSTTGTFAGTTSPHADPPEGPGAGSRTMAARLDLVPRLVRADPAGGWTSACSPGRTSWRQIAFADMASGQILESSDGSCLRDNRPQRNAAPERDAAGVGGLGSRHEAGVKDDLGGDGVDARDLPSEAPRFLGESPEAESPLDRWFRIAKRAEWANFAAVKTDFPAADRVGEYIVFNIGGNKFRLIGEINFLHGKLFVRHVLTDRDYDQGAGRRKGASNMSADAAVVGEAYLALIRAFPLRPIRSEAELRRAIAVLDGLIDRAGSRLAEEEDYTSAPGPDRASTRRSRPPSQGRGPRYARIPHGAEGPDGGRGRGGYLGLVKRSSVRSSEGTDPPGPMSCKRSLATSESMRTVFSELEAKP